MNPLWLVIWLSSVTPGYEQTISSQAIFYDTKPMITYLVNNIGELGDYRVINLEEYYTLKSDLSLLLQKK